MLVVLPHPVVGHLVEPEPAENTLLGRVKRLATEVTATEHVDHPVGLLLLAEVEFQDAVQSDASQGEACLFKNLPDDTLFRVLPAQKLASRAIPFTFAEPALVLQQQEQVAVLDYLAEGGVDGRGY